MDLYFSCNGVAETKVILEHSQGTGFTVGYILDQGSPDNLALAFNWRIFWN